MTPTASVIIPIYNGERYLKETLDSILDQTFDDLELITVDDGSSDNSKAIIKTYPTIRYIFQENAGVAAARNTGLDAATGEFIALLDQDDFWSADKMTKQVAYLRANPDIGVVFCNTQFFLQPGIEKPDWVRPELLNQPRPGYNLGACLIRHWVFNEVGRFDTQYIYTPDHDWFIRLKDSGIPTGRIQKVMLYKRVHDRNESQHSASQKEMIRIHYASIQRKKKESE